MLLNKLIKNVECTVTGAENAEITHLTIDSRQCKNGSLYFAINGTKTDGHNFVKAAYESGAVAAVVEHEVDCPITQVIVKNTRIAMSYIAANFFENPSKNLKMIGVTGTNGKTSVSYMIKAIAEKAGICCGVIGTSGIYAGNKKLDIKILTSTTPDPIELQQALREMVDVGAKWCVMEVTAHALDLHKVCGISFVSSGFTNLTQDHLDYFLTMENYAKTKLRFFKSDLSSNGVININDDFSDTILEKADITCITYGIDKKADIEAKNVEIGALKSSFTLQYQNEEHSVILNTTGLFNISNALCAIGCALKAGLNIDQCIRGIESFKSVPGRFEAVDTHNTGITVIVDYAHTPDGLENILSSINKFKKGRLICVFGCGGDRDAKKRPIMGKIAGELSDLAVLTSDNPRFEEPESIIDAIEEGIKKTECRYVRNADRKQAIEYALTEAKSGDVIAVCGKGDEDYQDINGEKHHFSDRETVEEILRGE